MPALSPRQRTPLAPASAESPSASSALGQHSILGSLASMGKSIGRKLTLAAALVAPGTLPIDTQAAAENMKPGMNDIRPSDWMKKGLNGELPYMPFPEEILYHEAMFSLGVDRKDISPEGKRKVREADLRLLDDPSPVISGYALYWALGRRDSRSIGKAYETLYGPKTTWGDTRALWAAEGIAKFSKYHALASEIYARHVLGNTRFPEWKRILLGELGADPFDTWRHEDTDIPDKALEQKFKTSDDKRIQVVCARVLINRGVRPDMRLIDFAAETLHDTEETFDRKTGESYQMPTKAAGAAQYFFTDAIKPQKAKGMISRLLHVAKNGSPIQRKVLTLSLVRQNFQVHPELFGEAFQVFTEALETKIAENQQWRFELALRLSQHPHLRSELLSELLLVLRDAPPEVARRLAVNLSHIPDIEPRMGDLLQPYLPVPSK